MEKAIPRREFLKDVLLTSSAVGAAMSFEEQALLAAEESKPLAPRQKETIPNGKLGNLNISRLICGGNLTSGFAHSRDLIYVSSLLSHYFTDEKVFQTWQKCEEQGINTAILRLDDKVTKLIRDYWFVEGGKMQWICQCKLPRHDWKSDILRAIDAGCHAAFVHGGVGDSCVRAGRLDDLAKAVELIKANKIPGGIAGHMVEVPMAVEKAGIEVDFYMKTLNAKNYWSAGPVPRHDSVWAEKPEKTVEFMNGVKKPWIAYKVLGAGAIHPRDGFRYAMENGADFMCVGMFDFQVAEDAAIARRLLAEELRRDRPWCA
jgi:hypothetical protein